MLKRLFLGTVLLAGALAAVGAVILWDYVRTWDAVVTEKFRTHEWNFPSKIYASGLMLYPGIEIDAVGLYPRLKELGYQAVDGPVERKGQYHTDGSGNLDIFFRELPYPAAEGGARPVRLRLDGDTVRRIEDLRTSEELFSVELEGALISGLYKDIWEERRLVTLHEVSPLLLRAIIDVEDQRFYDHYGIDMAGVLRAVVANLRAGRLVQGASTLTQQLMKNLFLTSERTLERKLREALMAVIVEYRFSKSEILERYINEIYLGQRGAQGIFGVWEASQFYFAKEPHELTIGEMALLAGLISGPNRYTPFRHPERALGRRNFALGRMLDQGDITPEQYEEALREPLPGRSSPRQQASAPYFVDFVRKELAGSYPADVLTSEGLSIHTSIDPHLQELAASAVADGLAALEKSYPRLRSDNPRDQLQACLIAIQPQTGAILAMMGGRGYASTQFNRCTQARRQPGSVFKPFTFVAAFEQAAGSAAPIQPTTRIEDSPFTWHFEGKAWSPANYRKQYLGTVTARVALEKSLNAATTRLAHEVGLRPILDVARDMGIESPLPPYPSVVLGTGEVSPFEVASAYSVLANSGLRARPLSIREVFDRSGTRVERRPVEIEQVISPETAYLVTHLMEGVLDRGTAGRARRMGFTRPAAGKTGTTDDYRDAWFAGFTPNLLAVVWVGFDHRTDLRLAGSEAALPIWTEFMKTATAGLPASGFTPPPGVAVVRIDPLSGQLATPNCPRSFDEAFLRGQEPTTPCPLHSGWQWDLP